MNAKSYKIIGVMSGTSLDGIDLAEAMFTQSEKGWEYQIKTTATISYPEFWKKRLTGIHQLSHTELQKLDQNYTLFLSQNIKGFIQENNLEHIDAVASHGHTVLHQPEKGITFQIGNLPQLAKNIDQKVICDFRVQDVGLGGQGAPLVPIGDRLLFGDFEACLNLGGFANISREQNGGRIAFDIGAVNTVLNTLAEKEGKKFDKGGKIAASGKMDLGLKKELDQLAFYTKNPPKSLGIEWVHENIFPILATSKLPIKDQLQTYCQHITEKIAEYLSNKTGEKTLVTGGGAFNSYFIQLLREKTNSEIYLPDKKLIDFKEALIFAFLGVLRLRGENNVLKSVTGAEKDHCSGKVFEP
jgi:anhydro-N-acetylmuramic acid kinase